MHVLMSAAPSLNKVLNQHLLMSLVCSSQDSVWYNNYLHNHKFSRSHQHECPTRPCLERVGDRLFCSFFYVFSWFCWKSESGRQFSVFGMRNHNRAAASVVVATFSRQQFATFYLVKVVDCFCLGVSSAIITNWRVSRRQSAVGTLIGVLGSPFKYLPSLSHQYQQS